MGAFFEIVLVIALIGTAVALYPIVTRQNDGVALGYVRGRLPEAAVIVVGIVSVVSVVTLRNAVAGAAGTDAGLLVTVGKSLVAIHDWTFLFGRGLVLGANTVLLAHLASIHQVSRPVPHRGPPRTAKHGSGWLCWGHGPTSLTACPHSRICAGTMRCRCLGGCAPPSVSLPSRLRRCHRVPGSAQMPAGRRRGPWPVPSGPATSPLASGRCWPSATAHRCEDGSRHVPSLTPGTWPPPSPAGDHALGSVVSWSSPLRPAVPWRAAASPAGCRRDASSSASSATPATRRRRHRRVGSAMQVFGPPRQGPPRRARRRRA